MDFQRQGRNKVSTLSLQSHTSICCSFFPISREYSQKLQGYKIIGISIISTIIMAVLAGIRVLDNLEVLSDQERTEEEVKLSLHFADIIQTLHIERGSTVLLISSNYSTKVWGTLSEVTYPRTSQIIDETTAWIEDGTGIVKSKEHLLGNLLNHRRVIEMRTANITVTEEIEYYTSLIEYFLDWLGDAVQKNTNSQLAYKLLAYESLVRGKSHTGIEAALGSRFFAQRILKQNEYERYVREYISGKLKREQAVQYWKYVDTVFNRHLINTSPLLLDDITEYRDIILRNEDRNSSTTEGAEWLSMMNELTSVLLYTQNILGERIIALVDESKQGIRSLLIINSIILAFVLIMFPFLVLTVFNLIATIQRYANNISLKTRELREEKEKIESLLYEILPPSVADKLRNNEMVRPEQFDRVTIYFSDIVGFTRICSLISPMAVVDILNNIYGVFDECIQQYDVYKVETIGDAYMVVSGLPVKNNNHVDEIARMSLSLLDAVKKIECQYAEGGRLSVRSGIHTGKCVAGIVGQKMPRYCLFGDSVNLASRMEATGEANQIQVSEATKEALNYYPNYIIERRGTVHIKDNISMNTYWLKGIQRSDSGVEIIYPERQSSSFTGE